MDKQQLNSMKQALSLLKLVQGELSDHDETISDFADVIDAIEREDENSYEHQIGYNRWDFL